MLGKMWLPISSEKLLEFTHIEILEENIIILGEVILRPPTIWMRTFMRPNGKNKPKK